MSDENIVFSDEDLEYVVTNYCLEPGARDLNKAMENLVAWNLGGIVDKTTTKLIIDRELIKKVFAKTPSWADLHKPIKEATIPGVVKAMAYSGINLGSVTPIQVVSYESKEPKIIQSPLIHDDMQESNLVSVDTIRTFKEKYHVKNFDFDNHSIHIHYEGFGTKKSGASSGVALMSALLSHMLNIVVSSKVAMTGTINLIGEVGSIGGAMTKVKGAISQGVNTFFLPLDNKKDFKDEELETFKKTRYSN